MLLVHIYHDARKRLNADLIIHLNSKLTDSIAHHLSVKLRSSFQATDVTLVLQPVSSASKQGPAMSHDIEIVIWAHAFPEHLEIPDTIATCISESIGSLIPQGITYSV